MTGECPRCGPKQVQTPPLLTRELNLDRRRERAPAPPAAPAPGQLPVQARPPATPTPPRPPMPPQFPAAHAQPTPPTHAPLPPSPQPMAPQAWPQMPAQPPAPMTPLSQPLPPPGRPAVPPNMRPAQMPVHASPAPGPTHAPPAAMPPRSQPAPAAPQPRPAPAPAHAQPAPVIAFAPPAATPHPPAPPPAFTQVAPPSPLAAPAAMSQPLDLGSESAAPSRELRVEPASLWRRLLAFVIDSAVIVGVLWLFLLAAAAVTGLKAPPSQLTGLDALMLELHAYHAVALPGAILGVLLAGTYCAVFAFLRGGRTLGRWALGLRLVDARGQAPTPVRAVTRAVLAVLSFGLFLVGFWLALFDRRGQALHDKLTSTFVVRALS